MSALRIRYEGGPGWGFYEATREYIEGVHSYGSLSDRIKITRSEDGKEWTASYVGSPYSIAHPECRYVENGIPIQSCSCPTVSVPGTYKRRDDAARAGWAHKLVTGGYVHYQRGYEGPPLKYLPLPPDTVRLFSE